MNPSAAEGEDGPSERDGGSMMLATYCCGVKEGDDGDRGGGGLVARHELRSSAPAPARRFDLGSATTATEEPAARLRRHRPLTATRRGPS